MATLAYRNSLSTYRRYLDSVRERPILQASLFLIFSLVLVIILIFTALRPTLITISGLLGSLKEQRAIEQQLNQKIQDLTRGQQLLSENQSRLTLLDHALPNKHTFASWTKSVERLVADNHVALTNINLDQTQKFTLTVSGIYPDLYRFLDSFERLRRLVLIDSLQLSKTGLVISGSLPTDND